jgi:hypothetical protein
MKIPQRYLANRHDAAGIELKFTQSWRVSARAIEEVWITSFFVKTIGTLSSNPTEPNQSFILMTMAWFGNIFANRSLPSCEDSCPEAAI